VFNDISGPVIPLDEGWAQEHGYESGILTRINWEAVAFLASRPTFSGTPGSWADEDVGTLQLTEEMATTLWIEFPYSSKSAYSEMPAGFRYPAALPYGPDNFQQVGTKPVRLALTWHSIPARINGGWVHYDNDMSAVQGLSTL
jgi:hypothetical protein